MSDPFVTVRVKVRTAGELETVVGGVRPSLSGDTRVALPDLHLVAVPDSCGHIV